MLTVVALKAAGLKDRDSKLADGGGLYLFVTRNGHRSWRWRYRWGGKEKRLLLGSFPELSLAAARKQRDAARRQLRERKDPGLVRMFLFGEAADQGLPSASLANGRLKGPVTIRPLTSGPLPFTCSTMSVDRMK